MIIHNRIRCKICGDVIESTSRHDFKWCKCKACAVNGGHDYLKRAWDPYAFPGKMPIDVTMDDIIEELSEYTADHFSPENLPNG